MGNLTASPLSLAIATQPLDGEGGVIPVKMGIQAPSLRKQGIITDLGRQGGEFTYPEFLFPISERMPFFM